MRIFILDDIRSIYMALREGGVRSAESYRRINPPQESEEERRTADVICLARNMDDATDIIRSNPPFDLWVLDNDLGPGEEGFTFLGEMIEDMPHKLPTQLVSCSANPVRREAIVALFQNYKKFKESHADSSADVRATDS